MSSILVHPSATLGAMFVPMPFSVIDKDVVIGDGVLLGSFAHVCAGARIGDGCVIGDHVTICADAVLGARCVVADFAMVGERITADAQRVAVKPKGVELGAGCTIGSHTVLMGGTVIGADCRIEDGAQVCERSRVGGGAVIGRGAMVENDVEIGARTTVRPGAFLAAHSVVEDDCFIGPGVVTTNDDSLGRGEERFKHLKGCTVRRGARIGGGAVFLPGVEIGEDALVAAGSVVTRDVAPASVVMGAPARVVREVPAGERLEAE
jgi:acetyltransferase-like isoleucine patch superfamily enzyme